MTLVRVEPGAEIEVFQRRRDHDIDSLRAQVLEGELGDARRYRWRCCEDTSCSKASCGSGWLNR
jgi:hypothetical protein